MRTMLDPGRLAVLTEEIRALAHLPGDLAELGVYRGGSARAMHEAAPQRRLHLFDTFSGLPAPGPHDVQPAGRFRADAAEVMLRLAGAPVTLHVGRFPDSIAGVGLPPLVFAHIDGDLYDSTKAALDLLWPLLVPGGVMVFDDYQLYDTPGVTKALDEFGHPIEMKVRCQAILRKPA